MSQTDPDSPTKLYDRLFDASATKNYNLSIRIQQDGLSFTVFSPALNKIIGLEEVKFSGYQPKSHPLSIQLYTAHCSRFLKNHAWLNQPFGKVNLLYTVKEFTLVPDILFKDEMAADMLKMVHEPEPESIICKHLCRWAEARIIFAIHQMLYKTVNDFFPSARISHHLSAFIETLIPGVRQKGVSSAVFLNVRNGFSDFLAIKNNQLVFVNSFECHSPEDSVYFLLFVMEQIQANPE
ncbi:MAG: DUF3822 family protein, partial [Lentimicrobiaceae bacterium]|nr:DUF3822 family protein [Lentimicrobiaceae bacterium]